MSLFIIVISLLLMTVGIVSILLSKNIKILRGLFLMLLALSLVSVAYTAIFVMPNVDIIHIGNTVVITANPLGWVLLVGSLLMAFIATIGWSEAQE